MPRNCPPNSDSISIFQSSHRIESAETLPAVSSASSFNLALTSRFSLCTFIQLINGPLLIRTAGYGLPPLLDPLPPNSGNLSAGNLASSTSTWSGAAAGLNLPDWKLVTAVNPSTGNKHAMHVNGFTTQPQLKEREKANATLCSALFLYTARTLTGNWGLEFQSN